MIYKDGSYMATQDFHSFVFSLSPVYTESRRQFEVAFKMIDVDRSDYIDLQEFSRVSYRLIN